MLLINNYQTLEQEIWHNVTQKIFLTFLITFIEYSQAFFNDKEYHKRHHYCSMCEEPEMCLIIVWSGQKYMEN